MRELNIHEKINFRSAMARKGLRLPVIGMSTAFHFWGQCYGYMSLSKHWLFAARTEVKK